MGRTKVDARSLRKKCLGLESLEVRNLLAIDGADLVADSYVVAQNSAEQTLDVLANDRFDGDYAGARLITSVSQGSQGGRLRIAEDAQQVWYAPPADRNGPETFSYFVDGRHSAIVTVDVLAPLADDFEKIVPDRESYQFNVLENDPFWKDYQGTGKITLVSASRFAAGVDIINDGTAIRYTRPAHVYGVDAITYIVDGKYPATLTVDIANPLKEDLQEIVQHDLARTYSLLANDPFWTGYGGNREITHILDVPEGAKVEVLPDKQSVRFDGSELDPGAYSIRYVVDNQFESYLRFYVMRPVQDDYGVVDQNSQRFEFRLLDNDEYYSIVALGRRDVISRITSVSASEQGATITVTPDGQGVLYTPAKDFVGLDSFTYTADDQYVATVQVTVRQITDSQINRDDYFPVYESSVDNRLSVLANDFFGDGYQGPRQITSVGETRGGNVSIAVNGKYLLYTPAEEGTYDSFTYEVDHGLYSAQVNVGVQSITSGDYYEYSEPRPRTLNVLSNDHFSGNYVGVGIITSVTQPGHGGTVSINADGMTLSYLPGSGAEQFTYTVDEKFTEAVSVSYYQRLTGDYAVVDQNSGVTEIDVLANDFASYTESHWGRYLGARVISDVRGAEHGTATVAANGKSINYQPFEDFIGSDTVTYVVDGFLSTSVTVDVTKRIRNDRVHVDPNSANNSLDLLANDLVSGDYQGALRITNVSASQAGGMVSVTADGKRAIYTPPANFVGVDSFEYTVDNQLKAHVTVEVFADVASRYPKFGSLESFKSLVLEHAKNGPGFPIFDDFLGGDSLSPISREHSETNVQVEGVDEADLTEADSDHLYTLTHGQLVITRAWPADDLEVLSTTKIVGTPIGQYLYGDRLAVISQELNFHPWFELEDEVQPADVPVEPVIDGFWLPVRPIWYPSDPATYITVLDVSDRANPKLVQRTEIEGSHVQTRRIDDYVYLVVRASNTLTPPRKTMCEELDGSETCRMETDEEYFARIDQDFESVVEDLLPNYESYGADGKLARTGLLVQPEDIFEPLIDGASTLVSVVAVDMTNDEPGLASTSGVLTSGGSTLYVTAESLYVFDSSYAWWGSGNETVEDSPLTKILKFNLNRESGGVDFAATGQVPGQMLNQFSADESQGYLRIATNVSNFRSGNYSGQSENALFVLRDDTGVLEFVGTIQNLALNENIQSVRFFGDRAVVTTFQVIDPLYSLDLSDPEQPRVEGHLTLPGFASYMQYVDQDRLLTIGRSSATGWGGALSISLFDVSDISQPELIDQYTWDHFSSSVAAFDHHAFGWFASHKTLAIPSSTSYTIRVDEDQDGYAEKSVGVTEQELQAFHIDASLTSRSDDGIELKGTMTMDSPLLRSAFIGDKLYAIAEDSIKSAEINAPAVVLDEVVIRPPDDPNDEAPDPRVPIIQALQGTARADLAAKLQVAAEKIMLVTTEADSDETAMVLRVGDQNYAYRAKADNIELERSDFRFAVSNPYHNTDDPFDVNGDGQVTAIDVLRVIKAINDRQELNSVVRQIPLDFLMVDTSNDGKLSPRDVLLIIEHINQRTAASRITAIDAVMAAAAFEDEQEQTSLFDVGP